MKICHYTDVDLSRIHPIIGGGAETSITHQRKAFDRQDIDYTTDPSDEYDILHLNLLGLPSIYHLLKAKRKGKKVVIHVHWTAENFKDSFRGSNIAAPLVDRYLSFAYSRADLLIAVSDYTKEVVESKDLGTPVTVMSNGVDGKALDGYEKFSKKEENEHIRENIQAVNMAAVFERKGVSDYLEASKEIKDMYFTWFGPKNKILTPGKTKRKIKKAPSNLKFPGYIDDKRKGFAAGDIFFFPSRSEEEGISLLEAAYCELPLVVRDIPAYEGWLVDGKNCLKADDVEGLIDNLEKLRDDPELREEIGQNAKEMADQRTLEVIGEKLKEAYRKVLS